MLRPMLRLRGGNVGPEIPEGVEQPIVRHVRGIELRPTSIALVGGRTGNDFDGVLAGELRKADDETKNFGF